MIKSNNKNIAGLILAAGFSSRIKKFKPLLKINKQTFLEIIIKKLELVCEEIAVIVGHNEDLISKEIKRINSKKVKIVLNPNYKEGMFTSLQMGIRELSSYNWVLYHFVDQPLIDNDFYTEFVKQVNKNYDWIQPVLGTKKGHPILLGKTTINLLLESSAQNNLKKISLSDEINKLYWECDNSNIFNDIDTDEDYKDALMRNQ